MAPPLGLAEALLAGEPYDGLPGMPFPGAAHLLPDDGARWRTTSRRTRRASSFRSESATAVEALTKEGGRYVVDAGERSASRRTTSSSRTGVLQNAVHARASRASSIRSITQLHSNDYRNLSQLQEGAVLVVGASHSGSDIAYEAAATHEIDPLGHGHRADSGPDREPARADRLPRASSSSARTSSPWTRRSAARCARTSGTAARRSCATGKKDLRAAGVERVLARTVGVEDGLPVLDDGRVLDVQNVVWCTGFRPDFSLDPRSRSRSARTATRCSTAAPSRPRPASTSSGLLFLHSFASMLIAGAGRDAERVATHIATKRLEGQPLVWNGRVTKVRELA